MKTRRIDLISWLVLVLSIAWCSAAYAGPLSGAIFTTDSSCTGVDLNIYQLKADVYLDGGPRHVGAAGLPPGAYCVQVTDPSGQTILGVSVPAAVTVDANGEFAACYSLFDLTGFADTPNPGGEYKVWVSPDCTFANDNSKTDNFKVKGGETPPPTANLCVNKFYDANANGLDDDNQPITGWAFQVFADNVLLISFDTPHCSVVDPGMYHVVEGTPVEPNWLHTTPSEVDVDVPQGQTVNVSFGNVCLGGGGGLTLGFWSNKNGQKLETPADLKFLSDNLCLRDGKGNDVNPGSTADLSKFLLNATATNMANMLSAQLAAMELNVRHNFVSGSALVSAGDCGNTGLNNHFISINDLMAAAAGEICAHPVTTSTVGTAYRAYQECLKNALDNANNNKNFVQSSPCSFSFP